MSRMRIPNVRMRTVIIALMRMRWACCTAGLLALGLLLSPASISAQNRAGFEAELVRLARQLGVGSLSAAVVEGSTTVWVRHIGTNARRGDAVTYSIGELTQALTGALTAKLVAQKKVTLDATVDIGANTPVQLRHVLLHTAAGTAGTRYIYSPALYDRAGPVLAKAAGAASLGAAFAAELIRPLRLVNTSAPPTVRASDGVQSTVEDVARLVGAFDAATLAPRALMSSLLQPGRDAGGSALPTAIGWFVQSIGGQQVRWQFGNQADGSSLVMSLPGKRLTLVVLARGNRLNAPFGLSFGDVRWSPVASAFLTNWAGLKLELPEARRTMTEALIGLASERHAEAAKLAEKAASLAPALQNAPDGALLAAFARSGQAPLWQMGESVARRLLAVDANHPRTQLDLGVLRIGAGKADEGRALLQKLLAEGQATPEIQAEANQILKRQ